MKKRIYFVFIGLSSLCVAAFLEGCSSVVLLDPKGPIGEAERFVILVAIGLMLIVLIPVFVMTFLFARRYRASNTKATYTPKWSYSPKIDLIIWLIPIGIVMALGILAWSKTHHLNPYKPISPGVEPIRVEVVSLDWKWLFIYPDHHIATVNELVFPAGIPLSFRITSDTVMTSFFIPQLGSQIYAMAGMQTRLHLMADEPGVYDGHNQQFSGRGFADMNFKAIAVPPKQFEGWVQKTRRSALRLDLPRFEELREPSTGCPVTYFSWVEPDLFDHILSEYRSAAVNSGATSKESGSTQREKTAALEGR